MLTAEDVSPTSTFYLGPDYYKDMDKAEQEGIITSVKTIRENQGQLEGEDLLAYNSEFRKSKTNILQQKMEIITPENDAAIFTCKSMSINTAVCPSQIMCVLHKLCVSFTNFKPCDWSTQLRMFRKLCWSLPQVVLSLVQDGATSLTLQWHCTLQRRQFSPQVDNVLPAFRQCSHRK